MSGLMEFLNWITGVKDLFIALGGAVVGGLFTMWATHLTQKGEYERAALERRDDRAQLEAERQLTLANTARLILVEITTAWSLYREEYAKDLMQLPVGAPFICTFPIGENTFPVFDSAPSCLAQLPTETSQQSLGSIFVRKVSSRR